MNPEREQPEVHSESFLHSLMARQLKLSIACAVTFLIALLGLPLANYFWPEWMATRVFGCSFRLFGLFLTSSSAGRLLWKNRKSMK